MSEKRPTTQTQISKKSQNNSDVVISAQGVSKKFCRDLKRSLAYGVGDISKELLGLRGNENNKLRKKEFWALQDVNFKIRRGEALGLIGKNGSGKSTLLRILAGLIKPDIGTVEIMGRVAPLIALGAGFNPVLTGRENIYANMSILGLTKDEIDEQFDEVVDFAEIGESIDSPVQSYSSGMAARLGFSCAVHTNPDILLIDEVLAVGDIKFRAKCNRKLHKLRSQGTSFVLVSHQAQSMLNVCDSAIYLSQGKLISRGQIVEVLTRYEQELFAENGEENIFGDFQINSTTQIVDAGITSIFFSDRIGTKIESPQTGSPAYLNISCISRKKIENIGLVLDIQEIAGEGENTLVLSSFNDGHSYSLDVGDNKFRLWLPYLGLKPGNYTMTVHLRKDSIYTFDSINSFRFKVYSKEVLGRSSFYQAREWESDFE